MIFNNVNEFIKQLGSCYSSQIFSLQKWADARPSSKNIYLYTNQNGKQLLYIKESNSTPCFWGITANRIAELNASGLNWIAILLLRSPHISLVFTSKEIRELISTNKIRLASDGDYKVNERDFSDHLQYQSIQNILPIIASCMQDNYSLLNS